MHGEGRKFVTALITLDPEAIEGWGSGQNLEGHLDRGAGRLAVVRDLMQGYVDQVNGKLERWETIKRFVILPWSSPSRTAR